MIKINKSKTAAVSAILSTAAILLGYVEFMIPVVPPIAGIKLGLGNIAVLLAIRLFNETQNKSNHTPLSDGFSRRGIDNCAFIKRSLKNKSVPFMIMLTKVLVCAMLFSGFGGLPYSLAGGIFSFAAMAVLCRFDELSAAGISAVGGAFHMAAQLIVAAIMTSTVSVMLLLPILIAAGTVTGFINGIIVNLIERNAGKYLRKCADL